MCCKGENHAHHSCESHGAHHMGTTGRGCGCGGGERRFQSKSDRMKILEEYKDSLKSELDGVEEELKALQGE